ncbi:MAG: hypothetical protein NT127_07860 [Sphingobacteriales bacterium]|nr:hypothetical protein [Sphingobacteriales bacterium]
MILLCGCPYNTSFPIEKNPQVEVNQSYLGNWKGKLIDEVSGNTKPIKVNISNADDFNYSVVIMGRFQNKSYKINEEDTVYASMFISVINNKQIANIKFDNSVFFADVSYQNNQISFLPLAENFTSFFVKTDAELKNRIAYHFKTRLHPLYDESFCLRSMTKIVD